MHKHQVEHKLFISQGFSGAQPLFLILRSLGNIGLKGLVCLLTSINMEIQFIVWFLKKHFVFNTKKTLLNWKFLLLSDRNKMMCHWFYRTTKLEYARYANNMLLMLKKLTKYWTSDDNNNRSRQFLKRNRQIQHFILLQIILLQTTVYILKSCRPCLNWILIL